MKTNNHTTHSQASSSHQPTAHPPPHPLAKTKTCTHTRIHTRTCNPTSICARKTLKEDVLQRVHAFSEAQELERQVTAHRTQHTERYPSLLVQCALPKHALAANRCPNHQADHTERLDPRSFLKPDHRPVERPSRRHQAKAFCLCCCHVCPPAAAQGIVRMHG